jgi:DNA-binding IclR family transcriptional regulator
VSRHFARTLLGSSIGFRDSLGKCRGAAPDFFVQQPHHSKRGRCADEISVRLTYMPFFHYLELNSTMQSATRYKVQVIDRALAILEVLADDGPALTLGELAGRIRLPKSTVLRLLNVLQQHRLVARDSRSGNYRLGLKLMELGTSAASQLDFVERARPHLNRLMATTGETVFLSVLDGTEALVVDRVESPRTIRVPLSAGGRTPAYCTANGKALLAFLPEAEIDARLTRAKLRSYTRNTIVTISGLRNELRRVRAMGYAVDHEEMEEGLKCVAAPVQNLSGVVVASVGILGPAFRLAEKKLAGIATSVVRTADAVSAELGFHRSMPEPAGRKRGRGAMA